MTYADAQEYARKAFYTRHPTLDDVTRAIQNAVSLSESNLKKCYADYQMALTDIGEIGEILELDSSTFMTKHPYEVASTVKERAKETIKARDGFEKLWYNARNGLDK